MLLDLDEMVQDHERTIEAQQQKIKEQAKEIDDLNTTIARLRHQYKHTCQTVREITSNANDNKVRLGSLDRSFQRLAANGTKLTATITRQGKQIERLQKRVDSAASKSVSLQV
ncbi:MAG: hypothetical protein L6R39_000995 [Caloplaca ligustica]|nr:MAG: hypothetical protein L6R39_000995 [Caloplaca ligustica]